MKSKQLTLCTGSVTLCLFVLISSGKGWYRYEKPGAKQPIADDDVTDLILQYCRKNGIQRRKISSQVG